MIPSHHGVLPNPPMLHHSLQHMQPARGFFSHAGVAQSQERRREPVWQAGEDDQALQHSIADSSSGTNAVRSVPAGGLGLRLKKSASLLEWLNKKLAEQGWYFLQYRNCDTYVWLLPQLRLMHGEKNIGKP